MLLICEVLVPIMQSFFNGEGMSTAVGVTPANKHKNRFANIVACKC